MLIGSEAMKEHFSDFRREPKDRDFFSYRALDVKGDVFWHESFPLTWDDDRVASPDELYTIKASHAYWDLHGTWEKHMGDLLFLYNHGARMLPEMHDILHPVWLEKHGKKRAALAKTKAEFFSDAVVRKYDHDSIHRSIAYNDHPIYEDILKDGEEVLTDPVKFAMLPQERKEQLVREEIMATALERWVIPSNYKCSPRAAYAKATKKTITSLTKGKFALWIVMHYQDIYKPDVDYVQVHRDNADRLILL